MLRTLAALALALAAAAAEIAPGATAPLLALIDACDLAQRWQPGWRIRWDTGEGLSRWPDDGRPHTHCSAFVAAICQRLDLPLPRPPQHSEKDLANRQARWLAAEGATAGWIAVPREQAQARADRGDLVLACVIEEGRSGHIAILRPGEDPARPMVAQAGRLNGARLPLDEGFSSHRKALKDGRLLFYTHRVTWPAR